MSKYNIPSPQLMANRCAKQHRTNKAARVILSTQARKPYVLSYHGPHAESRTGIKASLAALKRFWSTYHYVAAECVVVVPDIDAIYSDDTH